MILLKTNERWDRSFDAEGAESGNSLQSAQFNVKDDEGNNIGNAHVNQGSASVNLNIYNFGSVEEGIVKLRELLGVNDQ